MQLVRLKEKDDIETYLTIEADEISSWLSGKAQQAYVSLSSEEAAQYDSRKEAVLHRYNIEETYQQRFSSMRKGPEENYWD